MPKKASGKPTKEVPQNNLFSNFLTNNLDIFQEKCIQAVLNFEKECCETGIDLSLNYVEPPVTSHIERILFISLITSLHINGFSYSETVYENGICTSDVSILPQFKIDKYRIDFKVAFHGKNYSIYKELLIECDSQEFHERTEMERRYEKERDRYLISKGYIILHFTGREILENPFKISTEIFLHLTDFNLELSGLPKNF